MLYHLTFCWNTHHPMIVEVVDEGVCGGIKYFDKVELAPTMIAFIR
jgi:hypothetical protein